MIGPRAKELLRCGGAVPVEIDEQVRLVADAFSLELATARVTVELAAGERVGVACRCSTCSEPCEHVGTALSLILEEKTMLGLAEAPPERVRVDRLSDVALVERAIAERRERSAEERMTVSSLDAKRPWTDYVVTALASGRSYRVALRGLGPGTSYCSCPDFRKNTLGTCKHIINVEAKVRRRFGMKRLRRPYRRRAFSLFLRYERSLTLRLGFPAGELDPATDKIVGPLEGRDLEDVPDLVRRLRRLEKLGVDVNVYPDAEEFIQRRLQELHVDAKVAAIRADPAAHPLRRELLNTELLPYQLDGIAFAVGAGRAILADDMGLGKTIQGIGVAELMRSEFGIQKVLVVCPASLKAQWRSEIERFSQRACQLVLGPAAERREQYRRLVFFTICNYEQVLRDCSAIENVPFDLVILDEAQRIKNWEAKTSQAIKALRSRFALALSGTPLENRLDELYSVVEFIDERHLGPTFRFFNHHRAVNERGTVLGYENLAELRRQLAPILLRRTRDLVLDELPPRTTEVVRVAPTTQQIDMHGGHMQTVAAITRKPYISEMDLLRLQKALLMCRMCADSTTLVDKKKPGHSSKLERLDELLDQLLAEGNRKIVVFSEWTMMLDLIEERLAKRGRHRTGKRGSRPSPSPSRPKWVRLDGKVPQRKRQALVHQFQTDPEISLFLTSNAGSTGLNLQAANTVINVDLPWNPATLEQRIGRAHRMGQTRPVQVFVLVTEETIEENLLATLAAKRDLAMAVLDPDSEIEAVDMLSNIEDLRQRLEILLGAKPEAGVDEQQRSAIQHVIDRRARRDGLASAGGALVSAAFEFLGQLIPNNERSPAATYLGDLFRKQLADCLDEDEAGLPILTVKLPDRSALDTLANSLGQLLAEHQASATADE
jgi:superfamily II DNA or RNA helicase